MTYRDKERRFKERVHRILVGIGVLGAFTLLSAIWFGNLAFLGRIAATLSLLYLVFLVVGHQAHLFIKDDDDE